MTEKISFVVVGGGAAAVKSMFPFFLKKNYILATAFLPILLPVLYPTPTNPLILLFCSGKGRPPMDINKTWYIKVQQD